MDRKPITDQMILSAFLKQLEGKFPVGEFIAKVIMVCWIIGIPMFYWIAGVPIVLFDCVAIAGVYFGYYCPQKKKRLDRLEKCRGTASVEDFLIREDVCSGKMCVEEFIGNSYYITFRYASGYRLPVNRQQYDAIQEGTPFCTVILRTDRLAKYGLKKPFPPLWWHAGYWYRPKTEQ